MKIISPQRTFQTNQSSIQGHYPQRMPIIYKPRTRLNATNCIQSAITVADPPSEYGGQPHTMASQHYQSHSCVPVVCTGFVQGLYKVCTGFVQGLYRVCTGFVQGLYRVCTGYKKIKTAEQFTLLPASFATPICIWYSRD